MPTYMSTHQDADICRHWSGLCVDIWTVRAAGANRTVFLKAIHHGMLMQWMEWFWASSYEDTLTERPWIIRVTLLQHFPYDGPKRLTIKWYLDIPGSGPSKYDVSCSLGCQSVWMFRPTETSIYKFQDPKNVDKSKRQHTTMSEEQNVDSPKQQQVNMVKEQKCRHRWRHLVYLIHFEL